MVSLDSELPHTFVQFNRDLLPHSTSDLHAPAPGHLSSEVYIFQSHSRGIQSHLQSSSATNTDSHLVQSQRQNPGKGLGDKLGTPAIPWLSPCNPQPWCLLRTQACLTPNHFVKWGSVSWPLTFFCPHHLWLCHFWIKSHDFMRERKCHCLRKGNALIWKGVATQDTPDDKPPVDSRSLVSGERYSK